MKGETVVICGKVQVAATTRLTIMSKSGKVIPEFEPLFTFRAQDVLALPRLIEYLKDCKEHNCNPEHIALIESDIAEFEKFQSRHPDRMKIPD